MKIKLKQMILIIKKQSESLIKKTKNYMKKEFLKMNLKKEKKNLCNLINKKDR